MPAHRSGAGALRGGTPGHLVNCHNYRDVREEELREHAR